MQQGHTEKDRKTKILESIGNFIEKYRKVFIIVLSIIAVLVVALIVFLEIRSYRSDKSAAMIENIQEDFDEWTEMEDGEDKTASGEDIAAELSTVIDKYPNLYAGQRALFLRGSYYFKTDNFEEASSDFMKLNQRFP
ncbi:MAG: tetratricopeptide repeat protein, partial [Spirochaetia bacterium]